jgi:SAM-dependent methyltransferase
MANPDLSVFHTVDLSDEPAALIAFLQATDELPAFRELKSAMLEELRLAHARTVLDVGCGFGADLAAMLERMPAGSTATGLDISQTMISEGRRRAGLDARISFSLGDAMDLPCPTTMPASAAAGPRPPCSTSVIRSKQ